MKVHRLRTYDINRSYDWNYAHAPEDPPALDVPPLAGRWDFCGLPVGSPLGVPAGPLLNGAWIRYYAALGFDVLTYKTVRSIARAAYDLPNLVPVRGTPMSRADSPLVADPEREDPDSWAISFGMPSKDPAVWQEDVGRTRRALRPDQVLVVSVVASPESSWTLEEIAADFARCAGRARDGGAHVVEANLSCPNVPTQEGSVYMSAEASERVAAAIRRAVPELPLVLKVGLFDDCNQAETFVRSVSGHAAAISTTNCITTVVRDRNGEALFGGASRGIGGALIAERCLSELRMLRDVIGRTGGDLRLISVGGIRSADDVLARLEAGAHHVQLATAAMRDPLAGIRIRAELARRSTKLRST